jgi:Xaa-Pro dipeptidase
MSYIDPQTGKAYFWQGQDTHKVPMSLHAKNRARLVEKFQTKDLPKSAILLQGGEAQTLYDTDHEVLFHQESYFQWAFGVCEPGFYGLIDITQNKSVLFIPRLPESYAIWMGEINPPSYYVKHYEVDEAYYTDEISQYLTDNSIQLILTLKGLNTDSGNEAVPAKFNGIEQFKTDEALLFPVIVELRVIKTPEELEVLRYTNKVSSNAHRAVIKSIKPGVTEYQMESLFLHECYSKGGCRNPSYTCICCSGPNGAVLHYGHAGAPNKRIVKDGDMLLFDMGAEYHCYASDITVCFPANGKFTQDQREVYETVLKAHDAVIAAAKPGVSWASMHRLAERVILTEFTRLGFLKGDVEKMVEINLASYLMPHGLGHFLGIDTHDVGGYPGGQTRSKEPGLNKLRCGRVLTENMVITVEPGIYFIKPLLHELYNNADLAQFIVKEKLDRFHEFGGVRIESDVVITATGVENMTDVPRTVDEIEAWMKN